MDNISQSEKAETANPVETLPPELRHIVGRFTATLGETIREAEGDAFYERVEFYRQQLKKIRTEKGTKLLNSILNQLKLESRDDRLKLAHAFALQLEIVNVCESAYRSWRQQMKPPLPPDLAEQKVNLTFVLTAHPTEARPSVIVQTIGSLQKLMTAGIQDHFSFDDVRITNQIRLLWMHPISKNKSPAVEDEAEYIYSLIFAPELFDYILSNKDNFVIRLRSWVGGDKDGHPGVNKDVMKNCLERSRQRIVKIIGDKLDAIAEDLAKLIAVGKASKSSLPALRQLQKDLKKVARITSTDGAKLKAWIKSWNESQKKATTFAINHPESIFIERILSSFPALVLPLEFREDATLIENALVERTSPIRQMILELSKIAGPMDITCYARGFVISNCEASQDLTNAFELLRSIGRCDSLPVVPLFESKDALVGATRILNDWLGQKKYLQHVKTHWESKFEIMLGYSDSAKQSGVLSSRHLIRQAMYDIDSTLEGFALRPVFFHGSGGSVARGGGSLKEQISWWPNSALAAPKLTIQGEMIQRIFGSKEILRSQCSHLSAEATKRKDVKIKRRDSSELDKLVLLTEQAYRRFVTDESTLNQYLQATPYSYLEMLKIGSRPSRRAQAEFSLGSLRAIPWVLCWTQSRLLLPTWWGVGSAWSSLAEKERQDLKALLSRSFFFSSFVKAVGFTLSKVELDIWELYLDRVGMSDKISLFRNEYNKAVNFVKDLSGHESMLWYRPWLEESIRMRSPHVHILNLLQILAMNDGDEALLKETLVGIACGMVTTG